MLDPNRFLVSLTDGRNVMDVKNFVLSQPEGYQFEWKNQKFNRWGEKPLPEPAQAATPAAAATPAPGKKGAKKRPRRAKGAGEGPGAGKGAGAGHAAEAAAKVSAAAGGAAGEAGAAGAGGSHPGYPLSGKAEGGEL